MEIVGIVPLMLILFFGFCIFTLLYFFIIDVINLTKNERRKRNITKQYKKSRRHAV